MATFRNTRDGLRPTALTSAVWLSLAGTAHAGTPQEVVFDADMLSSVNREVDLSRFALGNPVDAGYKRVHVHVNDMPLERRTIRYAVPHGAAPGAAQPCFDDTLLALAGVRPERMQGGPLAEGECRPLHEWLPGARAEHDASTGHLSLWIPQAELVARARGTTDPSTWDAGINAARLNYAFNAYRTHGGEERGDTHAFLQLDAGLNVGQWRWRHRSTQRLQDGVHASDVLSSYVQTDLPQHGAHVTFGDFTTEGALFDSMSIRGARIASESQMLPDSLRGFAPIVRGVARSNALVTIRQDGRVIHEVTVPAGAFEIRDLFPTGHGGDLDVTVTEADGHVETFAVPFSSLGQLLRPGIARFSAQIGQWNNADGSSVAPLVAQMTWQRGLSNLLTVYAGAQVADTDYWSTLVGGAVNTRVGALSLDVTSARAHWPESVVDTGRSYRLSYSNFLPATSTTVMLAAHRYADRGFWSLGDLVDARNVAPVDGSTTYARSRSRFELQLDQPVGPGALFAGTSLRNFWNRETAERNAQLGYAMNLRGWNLGLSARYRASQTGDDVQMTFNLSVPLGRNTLRHPPRLTATVGHGREQGAFQQAAVSGAMGRHKQWSYGLSASHSANASTRYGTNVQYQGPYGRVGGTYSGGDGYSQSSLNAEGGILAHAGGVTFGPTLSDTIGLVRAEHAHGATLTSSIGSRVGRRGYAVLPSLTPYRPNLVEIDPRGLPVDVLFESTTRQVIPRAGSVVALAFDTRREQSWFLRAQHDGRDVPAGAEVRDGNGELRGTVGQDGVAYLTGTADALFFQWGESTNQRCVVRGAEPGASNGDGLLPQVDMRCESHEEET